MDYKLICDNIYGLKDIIDGTIFIYLQNLRKNFRNSYLITSKPKLFSINPTNWITLQSFLFDCETQWNSTPQFYIHKMQWVEDEFKITIKKKTTDPLFS